MNRVFACITGAVIFLGIQGCSKKVVPSTTPAPGTAVVTEKKADTPVVVKTDTVVVAKTEDTVAAVKPVVKKKPKPPVPKVITVNDQYAKKSVDGRLYYDLEGHRYWRSNKDGKYYLFNKSMLTDDEFRKPN